MLFLKITFAYDGAAFSGWQWQPTVRTVQGEFEKAWNAITGERVRVTAAGRTDAGVHAAGQVIGLETTATIVPRKLLLGLNATLPHDVVVRSVEPAPEGFHATHDAMRKTYRYALFNDRRRPLFLRDYVWHVPTPLDVEAMYGCGQELVGRHDFASLQSVGSQRESTVRTIYRLSVQRAGDLTANCDNEAREGVSAPTHNLFAPESQSLILIEVEGDGFLYNMVRAIAGTLVPIGRGRRGEGWLTDVLHSRDRCQAGQTAPPQGLMLLRVDY